MPCQTEKACLEAFQLQPPLQIQGGLVSPGEGVGHLVPLGEGEGLLVPLGEGEGEELQTSQEEEEGVGLRVLLEVVEEGEEPQAIREEEGEGGLQAIREEEGEEGLQTIREEGEEEGEEVPQAIREEGEEEGEEVPQAIREEGEEEGEGLQAIQEAAGEGVGLLQFAFCSVPTAMQCGSSRGRQSWSSLRLAPSQRAHRTARARPSGPTRGQRCPTLSPPEACSALCGGRAGPAACCTPADQTWKEYHHMVPVCVEAQPTLEGSVACEC